MLIIVLSAVPFDPIAAATTDICFCEYGPKFVRLEAKKAKVKSDDGISQPVAVIQILNVRMTNSRSAAGQKELADVLLFKEP